MNYKMWKRFWKPAKKNLYKDEMKRYLEWNNSVEAELSSERLLQMFHNYLDKEDLVGADAAKKHLHMGFARAKPYGQNMGALEGDPEIEEDQQAIDHAKGGRIFYHRWKEAQQNPKYIKMRRSVFKK